jgi:probable rRNA maturation factor
MNRIETAVRDVAEPAWTGALEAFAAAVLVRLGRDGWDLSFLICGDAAIRELNREYRGRDEPTDVLSFALGENFDDPEAGLRWAAGDIVVSLDALARNAAEFAVPADEELRRLVVHGILHLDGLDHATNDAAEPMLVWQEELLRAMPDSRILP